MAYGTVIFTFKIAFWIFDAVIFKREATLCLLIIATSPKLGRLFTGSLRRVRVRRNESLHTQDVDNLVSANTTSGRVWFARERDEKGMR